MQSFGTVTIVKPSCQLGSSESLVLELFHEVSDPIRHRMMHGNVLVNQLDKGFGPDKTESGKFAPGIDHPCDSVGREPREGSVHRSEVFSERPLTLDDGIEMRLPLLDQRHSPRSPRSRHVVERLEIVLVLLKFHLECPCAPLLPPVQEEDGDAKSAADQSTDYCASKERCRID